MNRGMIADPLEGYSTRTKGGILVLLSAFVALVVMSPILANGWVVWDDYGYVLNNSLVHRLDVEGIWEMMTTASVMGNYHPLTLISLAIDYHLGGSDPLLYHLHNIGLHLANVAIVFYFSFLCSRRLDVSFLVSLLFGIHPMHHEVVTWVSARKDLLSTLYYFASLSAYVHYLQTEKKQFYQVTILCFVLALLSKATAVTLPVVLLLLDHLHDRPNVLQNIRGKLLLFLISAAFGMLAISSQDDAITWSQDIEYSFLESLFAAAYALLVYSVKALLPIHLSPFHPYPTWYFEGHPWYIYASVIPVFLLLRWFFTAHKTHRVLFFGGAFFVVTILPLLQILPVGIAIISERYTYLPYFGLFYFMAHVVADFIRRPTPAWRVGRRAKLLLTGLYLVFLCFTTILLSRHWENTETLWTRVIDQYPKNFFAYFQRANHRMEQGLYQLAIPDYDKTLRYNPYYGLTLRFRSDAKRMLGDYHGAIADLDTLLLREPLNTGALSMRGQLYSNVGDHRSAVEDLNRKVRIDSTDPIGYLLRAVVLERLEAPEVALVDYTTALALDPQNPGGYNNRGLVLLQLDRAEEAIQDFNQAILYNPNFAQAYFRRAKAHRHLGRSAEALEDALKARDLGYGLDSLYLDSLHQEASE